MERGLTAEEKERVVRLHNERRAFVANGEEKRGDPGQTALESVVLNYEQFAIIQAHNLRPPT